MRLGVVILPEQRWPDARPVWQRAEELGFEHAWTYDHLAWRTLRDSSWFGTLPVLTAAAVVTSRIRLGPLVASPNYRHPVPFAKEVMTLDDVSGGRMILGIGSGGIGWDATVLGHDTWPAHERAERFAEFVELTDRLLRESVVSSAGAFYSADGARMHPGCVQQPRVPFAVAGVGRRAMRVAAVHAETWVTAGDGARDGLSAGDGARVVRQQLDMLEDVCADAGRDPETLRRLVLTGPHLEPGLGSPDQFRDTIGRYEEVGVTDLVVHWPRPSAPYIGDLTTFEAAIMSAHSGKGGS
jgi:alkanesulfonate monooxygenase SsuD/methylene tetrahydromethanopterin reductase-like flavin-dependent oxidoreductase (luciferase family)